MTAVYSAVMGRTDGEAGVSHGLLSPLFSLPTGAPGQRKSNPRSLWEQIAAIRKLQACCSKQGGSLRGIPDHVIWQGESVKLHGSR